MTEKEKLPFWDKRQKIIKKFQKFHNNLVLLREIFQNNNLIMDPILNYTKQYGKYTYKLYILLDGGEITIGGGLVRPIDKLHFNILKDLNIKETERVMKLENKMLKGILRNLPRKIRSALKSRKYLISVFSNLRKNGSSKLTKKAFYCLKNVLQFEEGCGFKYYRHNMQMHLTHAKQTYLEKYTIVSDKQLYFAFTERNNRYRIAKFWGTYRVYCNVKDRLINDKNRLSKR